MHFFHHCSWLLLFALMFVNPVWADREEDLARHNMVEITLQNGLRVCLKRSTKESEQFHFQLFALGGYTSLPVADQPSAWLAADIAWESGLDNLSGDSLNCLLDDNAIDMQVKVGLFDRQVEAVGPMNRLVLCLHMSRLLFANPQFNEDGYKRVLSQTRRQLHQKAQANLGIRDKSIRINMRNWHALTPFNLFDLDKVDYEKTQTIFKNFFHNPAEFTLVIVGDFDPKTVIPLIEKSLGSLTSGPIKNWKRPLPPSFPEKITQREFVGLSRDSNCNVRLTFPLSPSKINPVSLDLFCIILKERLNKDVNLSNPLDKWKTKISISYQFPTFPHTDPLWLVIKFTSSSSTLNERKQSVLDMLENVKKTGIADNEIKNAYQKLVNRRSVMILDNSTELSQLADYYRTGWDVMQLYPTRTLDDQQMLMIKNMSEWYPNLDNYSVISLNP